MKKYVLFPKTIEDLDVSSGKCDICNKDGERIRFLHKSICYMCHSYVHQYIDFWLVKKETDFSKIKPMFDELLKQGNIGVERVRFIIQIINFVLNAKLTAPHRKIGVI